MMAFFWGVSCMYFHLQPTQTALLLFRICGTLIWVSIFHSCHSLHYVLFYGVQPCISGPHGEIEYATQVPVINKSSTFMVGSPWALITALRTDQSLQASIVHRAAEYEEFRSYCSRPAAPRAAYPSDTPWGQINIIGTAFPT